jgi:hypothetical protein
VLSQDVRAATKDTLNDHPVNWRALAIAAYACFVGAMILRLLFGWPLMWRVVGAARPVGGNWAGGAQVRVSNVMRVPVTFASTVLCPSSYTAWSARKLQAVMLHEGSHVAHVDSYVLLLAAINRAIFWFNPLHGVAADSPCRSGESIGSSRPRVHRERLIHLRPARFGTVHGATVEIADASAGTAAMPALAMPASRGGRVGCLRIIKAARLRRVV